MTVPVRDDHLPGIPAGPVREEDPTLELALRRWIRDQAGIDVGYVEQLYTFGDRDRPSAATGRRQVAVAYLALVQEAQPAANAAWVDWYRLFAWEDHRDGPPAILESLRARLAAWAGDDPVRSARVATSFGTHEATWDGIRVLERYELLYEAELVPEAFIDRGVAPPPDVPIRGGMAFDHRRIVATAMGRLRGKLTYRPVVFELLPETFTLLALQQVVEALAGVRLHKQNFRRLVERGGLVEGTGLLAASTGGRPAELFRFRSDVVRERPRPGLGVPYR